MSTENSDVLENQSHGSIVSDVDRQNPQNHARSQRSEQQEWTVERVRSYYGGKVGSGDRKLAQDINAALATERQRREQSVKLQKITEDNVVRWMQRCEKFEQKLLSAQAALKELQDERSKDKDLPKV